MSLSEDLFGNLDQRQLLLQAMASFAFGLTGLLFAMTPASFVLAYLLQLWVVACLAGSLMFWSDVKHKAGNPGPTKSITSAVVVFTIIWGLGVALPMGSTWLEITAPTATALWPIVARAAPTLLFSLPFFVFMSWRLLHHYEQEKRSGKTPNPKKPVWHRAICVFAFVIFGPFIYRLADEMLAESWPTLAEERRLSFAIVIAYACCETYPYLAALFERWDGRRQREPSSPRGNDR